MRLILSLPVLAVVLAMVLEGPAPAQAAPDMSSTLESIPGKLKEFGSTVKEKFRTAIDQIQKSDFPEKTRNWFSDVFQKVKEKFETTFS
uniref:Apolipoprotein C-I n=1 Tax=Cynopterus brachyotis TaxID=58060 RepID=APOC1_CYNBR|nr:RecName: Full=Apolipoprotein C-I; Short=Apo-CI; Short=ApoC-I; AltName: Full=Apolipoprotein C1; Contains: RecName: Full=Truncated apolipoprotein C-I; Flags: Precursor [Cynopterus brachyotis]